MDTGLELSVVDDESGLAEDLFDWLRDEPELASEVRLTEHVPGPGRMGGMAEVAVAALSAGGVASVLVASLGQWLTRNRAVSLRVRRGDREIEVSASSVSDVRQLIESAGGIVENDL